MKKLLVWDCDETLWEGTIMEGDDPMLTNTTIEIIETLHSRGVIQSIASRNLLEEIYEHLSALGIFDYFLVPQADLNTPKSLMIKNIKEELGLSKYEDIVFVDDQRFNLAEVEENCEGIITCLPKDLPKIVEKFFSKESYNDDDIKRVQRYRSQLERKRGASSFGGSYIDFLSSCGMRMDVFHPKGEDMPRFMDLFARANKMSALDSSFSEDEIIEAYDNEPTNLLACKVWDKFGSYGTCGIMVLKKDQGNTYIRCLVISCRLQGKGVGSAMLGSVMNMNVGTGIHGVWSKTKYNGGMKNLYEWYKFEDLCLGQNKHHFFKRVDEEVSLPPWINISINESEL